MKRVGNLYSKVYDFQNLFISAENVMRGKKKRSDVFNLFKNLEFEILKLQLELATQSYAPAPYGQFKLFDPKERLITFPSLRDRIVQKSLINIIGPIFEKKYIYDSYASLQGKGPDAAVRRCQYFSGKNSFYLKGDIQKFFQSINLEIVMNQLNRCFKDISLLKLIRTIIFVNNTNGKGLVLGNLLSQYLANLYLTPLDRYIKENLKVKNYIRYMDDFLVFADTYKKVSEIERSVSIFLEHNLGLNLKRTLNKWNKLNASYCDGSGNCLQNYNKIYFLWAHLRKYNTYRLREKILRGLI